jgi:hypothetical protein
MVNLLEVDSDLDSPSPACLSESRTGEQGNRKQQENVLLTTAIHLHTPRIEYMLLPQDVGVKTVNLQRTGPSGRLGMEVLVEELRTQQ